MFGSVVSHPEAEDERQVARSLLVLITKHSDSMSPTFAILFAFIRPTARLGLTKGFSMFSPHTVSTELGVFHNAEAAFQAYRDPTNADYVSRLADDETTRQ